MCCAARKESPDVFKQAQAKPAHAVLQELDCWNCGVILFIEVPKTEHSYACVCGTQLEFAVKKQAA